jgi:hypothetical protein
MKPTIVVGAMLRDNKEVVPGDDGAIIRHLVVLVDNAGLD